MPDFTPFDVSVGTKSSPEYTSFLFSKGNTRRLRQSSWLAPQTLPRFTHLRCGPLTCRGGHVVGLNKAAINNPLPQTGTPCRAADVRKLNIV